MYACDQKWWEIHIEEVRRTFRGKLYTQFHNEETRKFAEKHQLNAIEGKGGQGLGDKHLQHGSNSGHQAINLAYLLGAERIFLLGYDMGATGQTHWFGDHKKPLHQGNYTQFARNFDGIAKDLKDRGIQVYNLTPKTNLTQFERLRFEDCHFHSVQ